MKQTNPGVHRSSVIQFPSAEMRKPYEIYRRMHDVNMIYSRKKVTTLFLKKYSSVFIIINSQIL